MSTNAPVRKPRAAHLGPDRRRPLVLDTALRIAVEDGIGSVSIASVASAMGVTRPVVYACFDDRVILLDALLNRETGLLLESTLGALHAASGDDPEQVFTDGFAAFLGAVEARPDSWRLVFDTDRDPEIARSVADVRRVVVDASTRWVAPALARWWNIADFDRKLPALIESFVSACEAAARVMLDPSNNLTATDLAPLYGRMTTAAYRAA